MVGGAEALDDDEPKYPKFLDKGWRFPGVIAMFRKFSELNAEIRAEEERARARAAVSDRPDMSQSGEDDVEATGERQLGKEEHERSE